MISPIGSGTNDIRAMLNQLYTSQLFTNLSASSLFTTSKTANPLAALTTAFVSNQAQAAYESLYSPKAASNDTDNNVAAGDFWFNRAETARSDMDRLRYRQNALEEYAKASGTAAGQLGLGDTYDKLGMTAESLAAYEKAVSLDGYDVSVRLKLGGAYADQKKPAEAEAQYKTALKLEPGRTDAYVALADLYKSQGKTAAAEKILNTGLSFLPGNKILVSALESLKSAA